MQKTARVLLFASFKELAGREEFHLAFSKPCSLKEFASLLRGVLPEHVWRKIFKDNGDLNDGVLLFLNKCLVPHERSQTLLIPPKAEVAFAPLASGG